jgi:hypothetical protein
MFLIFWSTFGSSARISAAPGIEGPGVVVPSMRPLVVVPQALLPAVPAVIELRAPVPPVEPEELAVPVAFVPGASCTLAEFPAPLEALPEFFRPPAFAGPEGTPLTPAVPAPAEPALGLPLPAVDPVAAPPAEAPRPTRLRTRRLPRPEQMRVAASAAWLHYQLSWG